MSITFLILFLTVNSPQLELGCCGINDALLMFIMKNEDIPAKLDAFEEESQRLLLDISLQNSARELHGIVNQAPKHTLPTYYKELEEWRMPIAMPSQQKEWHIVPTLDSM